MKNFSFKMAGLLLAMILGGYGSASAQEANCDLNGDGSVDVADVSYLISAMAGNTPSAEKNRLDENEDRETPGGQVDLGLPSKRLWADRNIGYTKDSKFGLYFAWGETSGYKGYIFDRPSKNSFDWANYQWMTEGEASKEYINKYQFPDDADYGAIWYDEYGLYCGDGQFILLPDDDAATKDWGAKWRMPTRMEIQELLDTTYTTQTWMEAESYPGSGQYVWGCEFRGKNNTTRAIEEGTDFSTRAIFLPACGSAEFKYVEYRDGQYEFPRGKYWCKEVYQHDSSAAYILSINRRRGFERVPDNMLSWYDRYYGLSIRPVVTD